ncbi:hypothetical protein JXI42_01050 [bacterium]|nr:hypothetical protein [bacterium]
MKNIKAICVIAFLLILGTCFTLLAEKENETDWSKPSTINPFDENIGDFLDTDIGEYWMKAFAYYDSSNFAESARYYLAYLRHDISNSMALYNLACCYGLLGKTELALQNLERAVHAGFDDFEHILHDPDFDSIKTDDKFITLVDSLILSADRAEKKLGEIIYMDASAYYPCRVFKPANYDKSKNYTLILGLHGWGSSPERFVGLWEKFDKPDFIYACPQAPYPFNVGEDIGYSWENWIPGDDELTDKARSKSEEYVLRWLSKLKEDYNIAEVYLMGFSQGAAFTYSIGLKNHELFSGIMPFGGWLDTIRVAEDDIETSKSLRVFIAHGTNDTRVKFESAIQARDLLREHGYDVSFVDFEGGHTMPEHAIKQAELWLHNEQ